MKLRLSLVASLFLLACHGNRAEDVTDTVAGRSISGVCLEVTAPVFMVVEAKRPDRYPEVPRLLVVPPESSLAPVSLSEAQYGSRSVPIGVIESIVPTATKLRVSRLWLKKSFEGDTIAITALAGQREVEVSSLFDGATLISLLDSVQTGSRPTRPILLDADHVRICPDTGSRVNAD